MSVGDTAVADIYFLNCYKNMVKDHKNMVRDHKNMVKDH